MLATLSSVLTGIVDSYTSQTCSYVNGVLKIMVVIGFGGFQANVIQFGIDQLHDSSTDEIASFILWYVQVDLLQQWFCCIFHPWLLTKTVFGTTESDDMYLSEYSLEFNADV